jgi:PST family polysaccharide transporter
MAKGAAWMVGLRAAMRGLGLLNIIILARLLGPQDFGLVALAMAFFSVLEAMGEFRPDVVLIRETKSVPAEYDTAWTLVVIRGAAMAFILAFGAGFYTEFFNEPRLKPIVYCLAALAFLEGFRNVGVVAFYKDLELHKEFRLMLASHLSGFVATICLAIILRNYWALIVGLITNRVLNVVLSYVMHPYRPRFSLAAWRKIMHFSKWLMLNNLLNLLYRRSHVFIIGKLIGAEPLGLYNVAHRISNLPGSDLVAPIRKAVFPGFARMAHEPKTLLKGFIDVFSLILLIGLPVTISFC